MFFQNRQRVLVFKPRGDLVAILMPITNAGRSGSSALDMDLVVATAVLHARREAANG